MTTQTEAERLAQWLLDNYEADEIDLAANLLRKQRADIEQLERLLKTSANSERRQQAEIERLNKALAEQPAQQEPVKWSDYEPDGMHHNKPAQQPVAFDVVCDDCGGSGNDRKNNNYRCAVCNGLGYSEKMLYTSPQAQPAQQAAAVMPCGAVVSNVYEAYEAGKKAQPAREWVGLTDEDKQIAFDDTQEGGGFWDFADAIEAILKRKNK